MEILVHRSPLAAALIAVMLLMLACVGPQHPSLELRELQADPAARLRIPGADQLLHFEMERDTTVDGANYAFDTYLFGTQVSIDEVFAFYETELRRLGWTRDDGAVNQSTTDLRKWGWCKPKKAFRLAVERPGSHTYSSFDPTKYRVIFDAGLIAVDAKATCGK